MTVVHYVAVTGCLAAPVGDSTMVLLPSMEYLQLDEVGAAIFEQVSQPATVDEIVAALASVYEVDTHVLRTDVVEYLSLLCDRGAVEIR